MSYRVMLQFGTASMGSDPIEWYQGVVDYPSLGWRYGGDGAEDVARMAVTKNSINSRDIKLYTLYHQRDSAIR